jgi:hypothetical protein
MKSHARFLFLFDEKPHMRWTTFDRLTKHCTDATRATYWGGVLSLIKEMGEVVLDGEKKAMAWLEKQANLRVGVHTPSPMTETQVAQLFDQLNDPVALALVIAWTLGQRPSDVLQLETKGVHNNPTGGVTLEFIRGKVIPAIGPFVIPLPQGPAEQMLRSLHHARRGHQFLFSQGNTQHEREALTHQAASILEDIHPSLEVRSVRRGGLQRMASSGMLYPDILKFSKHTSEASLNRYLNNGICATGHLTDMKHKLLKTLPHYISSRTARRNTLDTDETPPTREISPQPS